MPKRKQDVINEKIVGFIRVSLFSSIFGIEISSALLGWLKLAS